MDSILEISFIERVFDSLAMLLVFIRSEMVFAANSKINYPEHFKSFSLFKGVLFKISHYSKTKVLNSIPLLGF